MNKKSEIRSYGGDAAPVINGRTISGYAIVFNQRSEVMLDWSAEEGLRKFVEIIAPGSVTEDLLQRCDIKALIEHNRERLLARYNRGKGTLNLAIDEHGLRYEFEAPNTQHGDFAVEMVNRGDIGGSSFAFKTKPKNSTWVKEGDLWVRTINLFDNISDVTITTDPAYTQTEVSVRSLEAMESDEMKDDPSEKTYRVKLLKLRMNLNN